MKSSDKLAQKMQKSLGTPQKLLNNINYSADGGKLPNYSHFLQVESFFSDVQSQMKEKAG